jgi:hypothetical protein
MKIIVTESQLKFLLEDENKYESIKKIVYEFLKLIKPKSVVGVLFNNDEGHDVPFEVYLVFEPDFAIGEGSQYIKMLGIRDMVYGQLKKMFNLDVYVGGFVNHENIDNVLNNKVLYFND